MTSRPRGGSRIGFRAATGGRRLVGLAVLTATGGGLGFLPLGGWPVLGAHQHRGSPVPGVLVIHTTDINFDIWLFATTNSTHASAR